MYRESEKALGKKGSEEGKLKSAVTEANLSSNTEDVQALRNEVAALGFFIQNPEARQFEDEMTKVLDERPYLVNDLDAVLDIAKGRSYSNPEQIAAARKAGAKEALNTVAQAQRGAPPKASANQSGYEGNRITSENVDQLIAQHMGDKKWYDEHKAEIDAALA